jgi:GWxTD domain-containing protein
MNRWVASNRAVPIERKGLPALAVAVLLLSGCATNPQRASDFLSLADVKPAPEVYTLSEVCHLRYVLDEAEQEQYRALPPEGRGEMMRVFWAMVDPTPTTVLNERKLEHYRRLAYAREHFVISEDPGWDRRGELLLRLGRPDWRQSDPGWLKHGLGLIPPSETWGYSRLGLVFELEDWNLQGNYREAQEVRATSRWDANHPRFNKVETDGESHIELRFRPPPDLEVKHAAARHRRLRERGRAADLRGDKHFRHDYCGPQLTFAWDVQVFRTESGASLVEMNAAYKASELGFEEAAEAWLATVGIDAVVKTSDYREVGRLSRAMTVRQAQPEVAPDAWIFDRILFEVEPGEYRLAFSARDSVNRAIGLAERSITVPDFSRDRLALSTIQPALTVEPGHPEDGLVKSGFRVVPCPFRALTGDPDLYFYYEIYGLSIPRSRVARYETEFVVRQRAGETTQVSSTFAGASDGSTAREHLALDTSSLGPGAYDVEIAVTDIASGKTVSRAVSFDILRD